MTAQIIQFRDFQNPKDLARMYSEQTLEQQAVAIFNGVMAGVGMVPPEMVPYHGTGIDGMIPKDSA